MGRLFRNAWQEDRRELISHWLRCGRIEQREAGYCKLERSCKISEGVRWDPLKLDVLVGVTSIFVSEKSYHCAPALVLIFHARLMHSSRPSSASNCSKATPSKIA